jgi:hypothetical protein
VYYTKQAAISELTGVNPAARSSTSWWPVDLAAAIAGEAGERPELLARVDGNCLLYRGKVHWFHGEPEACKGWAAILACKQVLDGGGRAVYIDFEDTDSGIVSRLQAVGVDNQTILDRFEYIRPDQPLGEVERRDLLAVFALHVDLVIIDGVTEAMTIEGLAYGDNRDIAQWQHALPKLVARTGAAVVCIDHVTKDRETRGRYAIGGQHKLAGIDGAAYAFTVRRRFRRPIAAEPVEGEIAIVCMKDRPGWVRAHGAGDDGDAVGTLRLTSWPDGGVTAQLEPADQERGPDMVLCGRILEHLAMYDGASWRNIEEGVAGNNQAKREATKWMVGREWIRVEKSGQAHRHYLTDAGRENV